MKYKKERRLHTKYPASEMVAAAAHSSNMKMV